MFKNVLLTFGYSCRSLLKLKFICKYTLPSLSCDVFVFSFKAYCPQSANYGFLFQIPVYVLFLKAVQ